MSASDNLPARVASNPSMTGNAIELRGVGAETQLAIHANGRDYLVSPKDILEWVAPGAPIGEAKKFLVVCQTTGLNPLLGEIDLLPFSGKYQAVVRKNGYLKCARRDPDYDGHESGISVQAYKTGLAGKKTKEGPIIDIPGTCVPDGHLLIGGWCKMYRKGISRPVYKRVSFSEYGKNTPGPWQAIPCTMIEKVAIAHAARESFDLLAGTYDDSEMDRAPIRPAPQQEAALAQVPASVISATVVLPPPENGATTDVVSGIRATQNARILELVEKVKMDGTAFANMLTRRSVNSLDELTADQAAEIIGKLKGILDVQEWDPFASKPAPQEEAGTEEVIDVQEEPATDGSEKIS